MDTTTAPITCQTQGCDAEATILLHLVRGDGTRHQRSELCVADAERVYDLFDRQRRGKVEIEAIGA